METHVIVGAGAVGSGTARHLAEAGHEVKVITRSGSGPDHPNIERIAADAADREALAKLSAGAAALYNCANPPYHKWATAWPPLAASFLAAAELSGAKLITMSNLYMYANASSPMTPSSPIQPSSKKGGIRAKMWFEALAAHDAGKVRVAEVRASDYFGPGLGQNGHLGDRVAPKALAGKSISMFGDPTQPHSWSYIGDVAATLATVGTDDRALGRAWHVPTLPPLSAADMVLALTRAAGTEPVKVRGMPKFVLRLGGLFVPVVRELIEMLYQFEEPFVMDSTETEAMFGLEPTPLPEQLAATIASYR